MDQIYSDRLGPISTGQFQAVAARFKLGTFLKAEPTTHGLFGQNVFVTTSAGEFVLRGAPHWVRRRGETDYWRQDRWQFSKEKFFSQMLHDHTDTPVAWPMLHDEQTDIFGWPYLVMPRMPGVCLNEKDILKRLEPDDRRAIAVALANNLVEMQRLRWPFAGDFSPDTIALEPSADSSVLAVARETADIVAMCDKDSLLGQEDLAWIEETAAAASLATDECPNTYVHCDYKLSNMTLAKIDGPWRVSGLFDLHEARFSDGALDIVRQACSYLDTEPALARVFVDTYLANSDRGAIARQRLALYVINDRLKFFEFFARPNVSAPWLKDKTFKDFAMPYVERVLALVC